MFGTLTISKEVSESSTCVLSVREQPMAHPEAAPPSAITASWLLGLGVGQDAVARQWTTVNREVLDGSAARIQQLAVALGAPVPALFSPKRSADANREFVSFLETDAQRTAHALALKYSPRACQLFKLGAVWGYSEMVRPSLPGERAVFTAEINYYARQAGLPAPLWQPMLERTRRDATSDEIMTETNSLTSNVTANLMAER